MTVAILQVMVDLFPKKLPGCLKQEKRQNHAKQAGCQGGISHDLAKNREIMRKMSHRAGEKENSSHKKAKKGKIMRNRQDDKEEFRMIWQIIGYAELIVGIRAKYRSCHENCIRNYLWIIDPQNKLRLLRLEKPLLNTRVLCFNN